LDLITHRGNSELDLLKPIKGIFADQSQPQEAEEPEPEVSPSWRDDYYHRKLEFSNINEKPEQVKKLVKEYIRGSKLSHLYSCRLIPPHFNIDAIATQKDSNGHCIIITRGCNHGVGIIHIITLLLFMIFKSSLRWTFPLPLKWESLSFLFNSLWLFFLLNLPLWSLQPTEIS